MEATLLSLSLATLHLDQVLEDEQGAAVDIGAALLGQSNVVLQELLDCVLDKPGVRRGRAQQLLSVRRHNCRVLLEQKQNQPCNIISELVGTLAHEHPAVAFTRKVPDI